MLSTDVEASYSGGRGSYFFLCLAPQGDCWPVGTSDPVHVAHLEETALEELQLGFLEGSFESEVMVTATWEKRLVCGPKICACSRCKDETAPY